MPREIPYQIRQTDPNITADATFGTTWRDTWSWQCPENLHVLIKAGDTISFYIEDGGDVEIAAPDAQVKIEVRDPSGSTVRLAYGPSNYISAKEFQDKTKKAKLWGRHEILVKPREKIVFAIKDNVGLDAASILNSFFIFATHKWVD